MKKLLMILAIAAFISCNETTTNVESTTVDSTAGADSAANNVVDTTKKFLDKAKELVDSAGKKIDRAADKLIDTTAN